MKKIFKYTCLLIAFLTAAPAVAQVPDPSVTETENLWMKKTVKDNEDGTYTLNLQTYAKGEGEIKGGVVPSDIVIAMDLSSSMTSNTINGKTRLAILKEAAVEFVNTVYENNPTNGEYHKIGMVGFNKTGGNKTYSMADVTNTNKNTMVTWINDLSTTQGTRTDQGLQEAYNFLNALREDGRPKTVVLFSDGCPSTIGGSCFTSSYAQAAVNYAYAMKQPLNEKIDYEVTIPTATNSSTGEEYFSGNTYTCEYGLGATIYSVAILSAETSGDNLHDEHIENDIRRLLHYISSNYNLSIKAEEENFDDSYFFGADHPDAVCQIEGETGTGSEAPHDYYQLSDGTNLKSMFTVLAEEIVGAVAVDVDAESAVLLDVVSKKFRIPEGTEAEHIKLYTCDVVTTNTTGTVWQSGDYDGENWVEWKPWETTPGKQITDYIHINGNVTGVEAEGDYIEVTGYDFADNFVGPVKNYQGEVTGWHGQKLIIEFNIETDPSNEGGLGVKTNDPTSGLYAKKTTHGRTSYDIVDDGGDLAVYKQPEVNLPYIKIVMNGLEVGESALFRITKVTAPNSDEAVTDQTAYTTDVVITRATESQDDTNPPYAILKLVCTGDYRVEQLPWAWAYTHETTQWGHLSTVEATADTKFLTFTFTNTPDDDAAEHAEDFVPNNMSEDRALGAPKTGESSSDTGEGTDPGEDGEEEEM